MDMIPETIDIHNIQVLWIIKYIQSYIYEIIIPRLYSYIYVHILQDKTEKIPDEMWFVF